MSEPTAPPVDVIHDIGYRHYEGERLGRSYAVRSLFTQTLRGSFGLGRSIKSKILPMGMLALMSLPAGIIVAVAVYTKMSKLPVEYSHYLDSMQFVIALFVASQAPVAVSRDLRFLTLPLYFSRPLTSRDYVRAKFGAMFCSVLILTALPVLIMWIGTLLAQMSFGYNLRHVAYGLVAALLYSVVYAAIGVAIATMTPRRGFGVAAIIAVMLISLAVSQIIYAVLNHSGHFGAAPWANVMSPARLVDSTVSWLFSLTTDIGPGDTVPSTLGGYVFIAVIILIPAVAYGLLVRRYRKI